MPRRKIPLETGKTYNVFNTPKDTSLSIFRGTRYCQRAVVTTKYYQFDDTPLKLSIFLSLSVEEKEKVLSSLIEDEKRIVEIVAYCFIPKRFEFLLTQLEDGGISKFMSRFQNSFTRYFNSKENRKGGIFAGQFKAKPVKDKEIAKVSKKIHLLPEGNPMNYQWSSIGTYFENNPVFVNPEKVLSNFGTPDEYKRFMTQT